MIIEDDLKIISKMNNKIYHAGSFPLKLRKSLFKEHFGLDDNEVSDPLDKKFLLKINSISQVFMPN